MMISVIVPLYNGKTFLRQSVCSILEESSVESEIIIVDDGSKDGGAETVVDLPVKIIRQTNQGIAAARNAGMKVAKGEFITFLDSDDTLVPGGLSARCNWLKANSGAMIVGGIPHVVIEGGIYKKSTKKKLIPSVPKKINFEFYRQGNFYPVCCSLYLYRQELIEKVGLFDSKYRLSQDLDYFYRILQVTDVTILSVPVFNRRLHDGNISVSKAANWELKPENVASIQAINQRYGIPHPKRIIPWEINYL
jgi:glycosyltransferase involved in cell wall biosynthesis